ncbi:MAG: acyltransferase [Prevotella sp.]|nr:acyltransferase [Prevotella sp.]
MGILFPKFGELVTGGAIGDGLFFFCSGFTLFLGRKGSFLNWYKRRVNRIYPTIIMWALLSAGIFNWEWVITDLITTPRYWFIPCIMVYYAIFYIIRTYMLDHLKIVFILTSIAILLGNFLILDLNSSVMYADIAYMRIYYFCFMLLGAIVAYKKMQSNVSLTKCLIYVMLGLIIYYTCMGVYKIGPFFCHFQLVSLIPLIFAIYWMYQTCENISIQRLLESKVGSVVYFISCLTLEIYMVQYAIFTNKMNTLFPLNIVLTYMAIFLAAYVLKCASKLFSQIFSEAEFDWCKIIQL